MNKKDHFCLSRHLLSAIALYPTQHNWKCLNIRNRQNAEFHISNFCSRRSLGRKPRFFSSFKQIVITKPKNQALLTQSFKSLSE